MSCRPFSLRLLLVLLAVVLAPGFCPGRSEAAAKPTPGWSSVIVRLDGPLSAPLARRLHGLGGSLYRHLPLIRSVAVRLPSRNVGRLSALPGVRHVSPDAIVHQCDEFTVGGTGADIAFSRQHLTGAGVTIAVLDSGVSAGHQDLAGAAGVSRVAAGVNFAPDAASADDLCGHGTHVAGLIAGSGAASAGPNDFHTFYGIARSAGLVNVRVLDAHGQGAVSDVIRGLSWVISNKSVYGIRIVNLSLGHPAGESYTTDPLCQAVEQAWQSGLVVVCAAGNTGRASNQTNLVSQLLGQNEGYGTAYGSIQCPGNDPDVITVGALKQTSQGRAIATYSSRGPTRLDFLMKPDLVAPGNRVISLNAANSFLSQTYGATNQVPLSSYVQGGSSSASPDYFVLSGTSMAAPVVSGAAALLLEADPTLSPDTVKARLMVSADKPSGLLNDTDPCTWGAGMLDIPAALQCRCTATRTAATPRLQRGLLGLVFVSLGDVLAPNRSIWGTGLSSLGDVWGAQMIWGENTLSGSQMIWGESVWSDQMIWGESYGGADLSSTALNGE